MIKVYSKPNCHYCSRAKKLLEQKGIPFEMIDITENPDDRQFLINKGHKQVPQFYYDNEVFVEGGFEGLSNLSNEELKAKLEAS